MDFCFGFVTEKRTRILVTLQSLTGKYRGLQGNTCNENRDPAMRTGVPCNENRFFPGEFNTQGKPYSGPVLALYRIAVQFCSRIVGLVWSSFAND